MKKKAILKDYFKALTDVAGQGDAREESLYSYLETPLVSRSRDTGCGNSGRHRYYARGSPLRDANCGVW